MRMLASLLALMRLLRTLKPMCLAAPEPSTTLLMTPSPSATQSVNSELVMLTFVAARAGGDLEQAVAVVAGLDLMKGLRARERRVRGADVVDLERERRVL